MLFCVCEIAKVFFLISLYPRFLLRTPVVPIFVQTLCDYMWHTHFSFSLFFTFTFRRNEYTDRIIVWARLSWWKLFWNSSRKIPIKCKSKYLNNNLCFSRKKEKHKNGFFWYRCYVRCIYIYSRIYKYYVMINLIMFRVFHICILNTLFFKY